MVLEPTQKDDIQDSIETRLRGRIKKITNFASTSFNSIFLEAFSDALYEYEVRLLAAQLSGWVDYAGGPIEQEDIDRLGLREFDDIEKLNSYMRDEHLEYLGAIVGVQRDTGSPATGEVRIATFDADTPVPDGLRVATPSNANTERKVFEVDIDGDSVTPEEQGNSNYVDVSVVAVEPGDSYNVGSDTITQFISPPSGIEAVSNTAATSGGEDKESNEELRLRVKNAVFESSGGGTTAGIRGYIIGNVEGVNDVFLNEFFDEDPTFVNVVVDGGTTSDVTGAIEESRPAGIEHNLVRPTTYNISVEQELFGSNIDSSNVIGSVEEYIFDLDLGDDFIHDKAKQSALNIEPNIENILTSNLRITSVLNDRTEYVSGKNVYDLAQSRIGRIDNEEHYFVSDTEIYELDTQPIDDSSVSVEIRDGSSWTSVSNSEYDIIDDDSDGILESIDWSTGSVSPDAGSLFRISYDTVTRDSDSFTYDGSDEYTLTYPFALADNSSVSDNSGDTYTLGTDYDIIDIDNDGNKDTLKWLSGGSTPDSSESFTVTYDIDAGIINSVTGTLNGTSGHSFIRGTDFEGVDSDGDGYVDAIDWSIGGDTPDDGTEFSVDMSTETTIVNDYVVDNTEKASPSVDEIEVTIYE